jgi:hypothetical protein
MGRGTRERRVHGQTGIGCVGGLRNLSLGCEALLVENVDAIGELLDTRCGLVERGRGLDAFLF